MHVILPPPRLEVTPLTGMHAFEGLSSTGREVELICGGPVVRQGTFSSPMKGVGLALNSTRVDLEAVGSASEARALQRLPQCSLITCWLFCLSCAGRADGQGGCPRPVHRGGHLGGHTAPGGHEGERHRQQQQQQPPHSHGDMERRTLAVICALQSSVSRVDQLSRVLDNLRACFRFTLRVRRQEQELPLWPYRGSV